MNQRWISPSIVARVTAAMLAATLASTLTLAQPMVAQVPLSAAPLSAAPLSAAPLATNQWPRFLNASIDGKAELLPSVTTPVSDLDWRSEPTCLWSLPLGEGYGLGVVVDGFYYHFDALPKIERLRKIELSSGTEIWSSPAPLAYSDLYGYESGPRCCPTVADDQIFTLGVAGRLSCRNLVDGQTSWSVETNDVYGVVQNFFGVGSSPLVVGDLVIVMVGGSPAADQSIAPGRLDRVSPNGSLAVAFDRKTGKEQWRCGDDLASYSSPRTMQIGDRTVVLLLARDHLNVIDPATGIVLGRIRHRADILESVNAMVPVVSGNQVFISDCYDLGGVLLELSLNGDRVNFGEIWRDPMGNRRGQSLRSHMSTPVLHDGFLYACSGRNAGDSDFRCVRWSDGEVMWSDIARTRTTATMLGDVLLVLRESGSLAIVRRTPERFDSLADWQLQTASKRRPGITFPCWSAPIVVGDRLLVRGDQTLLCLQLPSRAK